MFNYAGYGRSFGGSSWNETTTDFCHGCLGALKRVIFSTFLAFKPSSESLKSDAAVVARYLVDVVGVDELIIHGESIGGMAAAGAARALTAITGVPKVSALLICDRTFCNLEAVAQRLVGKWTGPAIRLLTPMWSTDVAGDFLVARCPKVVAQDSADEIIHDYSSLKTGLSFAGELTKGLTKNVGWIITSPLEYRVADMDNVSLVDSRLASNAYLKSPPTWPADKRISWSEAHHFAACVRRVGKLATAAKKQITKEDSSVSSNEEGEGMEVSLYESSIKTSATTDQQISHIQKRSDAKALAKVWKTIALCDGLCGHPLGHTVKEGTDCTISWLCCAVTYGAQVLACSAEQRLDKQALDSSTGHDLITDDFDLRPHCYRWGEGDLLTHPLPIPVVLSMLKGLSADDKTAIKEG